MRYSINLATRTYLDHQLLNRLGYCAIALLLAITGWNVSQVSSNMSEQTLLNSEVAKIQNRTGAKPSGITEADFSRQKGHIRFYNKIIESKSTDWLALLELFENTTPEGIALASLSPDKGREEWKLEGHARTFKSIQQYLEKLDAAKYFSDVLLLSHRNMVSGEKSGGVQFAISCKVLH